MPEPGETPTTATSGEAPVIITADGQNTYFGDIATADDNVILRYKDTVIFADHMIYDRSSHVVTANGNFSVLEDAIKEAIVEAAGDGDEPTPDLVAKQLDRLCPAPVKRGGER